MALASTVTGPTGSDSVPMVAPRVDASVRAWWKMPSMVSSPMTFSAIETPIATDPPTPDPPPTPMEIAPAVAVIPVPSEAMTFTAEAARTVLPVPIRARVVLATMFLE